MAKKFFWLKLKDNFFNDKRIKKLRRVAGGDTYTLIYLKMQLLSLKNEGKLYFEGLEDSFEEEMALELDESVENVTFTIMFLKSCDLLEECNENEFALIETMNSIGTESSSAERVRKHRDKQKALQCNNQVTIGNTEIEIDIEKEKDIKVKSDLKQFLELYNSLPNLLGYQDMNTKRETAIKTLIKKKGLDNVLEYLKSMNTKPFVISSKYMKLQFMKFDVMLREATYTKWKEGGYMNICEGYNGPPIEGVSNFNSYKPVEQPRNQVAFTGMNMYIEE